VSVLRCTYVTHRTDGIDVCWPCPLGTATNETGLDSCAMCAVGTYQNRQGQHSCVPCSAGGFQNEVGKASCKPCPEGFFSNSTGKTTCLACESGEYQDEPGQASCKFCALGKTSFSQAVVCKNCQLGQFGVYENKTTLAHPISTQFATCSPCTDPEDETTLWTGSVLGSTTMQDAECRTMDTECKPCNATICQENFYLHSCSVTDGGECRECNACPPNQYRSGCSRTESGGGECLNCASCTDTEYLQEPCTETTPGVCAECSTFPCPDAIDSRTQCGNGNAGSCLFKTPVHDLKVTQVLPLQAEFSWQDGNPSGVPFYVTITTPDGVAFEEVVSDAVKINIPLSGMPPVRTGIYTFSVRGTDHGMHINRRLLSSSDESNVTYTIANKAGAVTELQSCALGDVSSVVGTGCQFPEKIGAIRVSWGRVSHYGYEDDGVKTRQILGYRYTYSTNLDTLNSNVLTSGICYIDTDDEKCTTTSTSGILYIPVSNPRDNTFHVTVGAITDLAVGNYSTISGAMAPTTPGPVRDLKATFSFDDITYDVFPNMVLTWLPPVNTGGGAQHAYHIFDYIVQISLDGTWNKGLMYEYNVSAHNLDITSNGIVGFDTRDYVSYGGDIESIAYNTDFIQFRYRVVAFNELTKTISVDPIVYDPVYYGTPSTSFSSPSKYGGNCSTAETICDALSFLFPLCIESQLSSWTNLSTSNCHSCAVDANHPTCASNTLSASEMNETYIAGCGIGSAGNCTQCTTCGDFEYQTVECRGGQDNTQDRVCVDCVNSSNVCDAASFKHGCGGGDPGVCLPCSICETDNYALLECGIFLNAQCEACASCDVGNFRQGCGNASSGSCMLCSSCELNTYTSTTCSDFADAECTGCGECDDGFFREGCGGTNPGGCTSCTTCVPNTYTSTTCSDFANAECTNCGVCEDGFFREGCGGTNPGNCTQCASCGLNNYSSTACSTFEDTKCSECPENTMTDSPGSTSLSDCSCIPGYYK
jgi:hypothetical protein